MTVDVRATERVMREMYLPAFEASVKKADVGSVMCSYNKVDGKYACENPTLLTEFLRDDWGFDGFVVSDWGAVALDRRPRRTPAWTWRCTRSPCQRPRHR